MVGESLAEHIRRLRLERAAMRLRRTDRAIIEIALEAGYETHEAFTRAFRTLWRCSPSRYRQDMSVSCAAGTGRVHYQESGSITNLQLPIGGETMEVRIEHIEPLRVAFVRHVGPYVRCKLPGSVCVCNWERTACSGQVRGLSASATMTRKSQPGETPL